VESPGDNTNKAGTDSCFQTLDWKNPEKEPGSVRGETKAWIVWMNLSPSTSNMELSLSSPTVDSSL